MIRFSPVLFCICALACMLSIARPLWAESSAPEGTYVLRGQAIHPTPVSIDGKTVWRLDDPEVQKLITWTAAQLQWSSTGQTLYVFTPGQESFWTVGSDRVSLNGTETEAPGTIYGEPRAVEPQALFLALRLTPVEQEQQTILLPTLTAIAAEESDLPGRLAFKLSAPVKPQVSEPEPGVVRLEFEGTAWGLAERTLNRGEIKVSAQGGTPGEPLVVDVRYPANWGGAVRSTLAQDLDLVSEPRHLTGRSQAPGTLNAIRDQNTGSERTLVLDLDRPCQFYWAVGNGQLTLEIPQFTASQASLAAPGVSLIQMKDCYPVLRVRIPVETGQRFEFYELEEQPGALAIHLAPEASLPVAMEPSGTATTTGFVMNRGTIVIDPGHGGSDPGCCNRALGVYEKDVTLDISLRLKEALEGQGWKVVLTRSDDRDVTYAGSPDKMELQARSDVANRIKADLFISIHCNASVSNVHRGTSIHWYKPEDYELARSLEHVLGTSLGFAQKGLIRNRFMVLRCAEMPAVLVETAYLTNPTEGAMLSNRDMRQRIAERLAQGLASYVEGRFANRGAMPGNLPR